MSSFKNAEASVITQDLIKVIQKNKQYLSDIDGEIGDGDHGINMNKGFTLCGEELAKKAYGFSDSLLCLSKTLMTEIGGAMGPLYGVFFRSMAKAVEDKEDIDAELVGKMLSASVSGVQSISQANVGDKTLMDVLIPASQSYNSALENGERFEKALDSMAEAARQGRDSTKDLVAKIGRSSRLGQRSKGVIDAGAASCCLILENMGTSIKKQLKNSK
mgnify:CR=1 FL=1